MGYSYRVLSGFGCLLAAFYKFLGCSGVRAVWVLCSGFRLKLRRI